METENTQHTRSARPWLVHCDRRLLQAPISHIALRLWLLIDAYTGPQGSAWPGNATLGSQLGCDTRTVRRVLDELKAAGLLTVILERGADGTRRTLEVVDERQWCDARNVTFGGGGGGHGCPGGEDTCALRSVSHKEGVGVGVGVGGELGVELLTPMNQPRTPPTPTPTPTPKPAALIPQPPTPKATPTGRPLAASEPRTAAGAGSQGRALGKIEPRASCAADAAAEDAVRHGRPPLAAWLATYDRVSAQGPVTPVRLPNLAEQPTPTPLTRAAAAAACRTAEVDAETPCPHGITGDVDGCALCNQDRAAFFRTIRDAIAYGRPVPGGAAGVAP